MKTDVALIIISFTSLFGVIIFFLVSNILKKKINELVKKNKFPGENFYKKLIANAILFKVVDKLFGRKNIKRQLSR